MIVVSDTSPLIALDYLGDLELLPRIVSSTILIPPAVAREMRDRRLPRCIALRSLIQPVGPRILQASLGLGESEAITLALEVHADYILLDDKAARRLAIAMRLPVLGTLALLVRAKQLGLVTAIRPRLDALRALPFHIAPALYDEILASVQE